MKNINLTLITKPLLLLLIGFILFVSKNFIDIPQDLISTVNTTIRSIFILAVVWALHKLILPLYQAIDKEQSSLEKLIIKIVKIIILVIGGVTILQEWGYNVTGFIASLGLLGMAFALAAKDTVANLFGSFVIFTDKPFKVGDWIKTPDVEGTIEHIDIRSTKIRTFAQALVTVPNAVLANSAIINWSQMGKRRIKMKLGLTYDTDAKTMQTIVSQIKDMLKNHPDIHQDTIYIYFTEFDNSSLNIFCYYFTNTTVWGDYMAVKEDTNLKIMEIIEKNNANFAFPSQSLYIENKKEVN
ncbi:MAG: mechanosensitive ion channel family protein [Campylobacterales bacterium]|nr:mechanosensitive ion channel family protein [Campylobacterales bacterium]